MESLLKITHKGGRIMGVTLKLAEFAVNTAFEDMPTELIIKGKERVLDTMGCILAGCNEQVGKIILQYIKGIGGIPESTVIGDGYKTSIQNTALANGTIGHALDFDDSQLILIGHGSVVILPAVLAIAEKERISGKKVLEAFLIGFEVACKIGRAVNPKLYNNGWHATSVIGVLGAAAAAGKLLGLDTHKMTSALGIAASQACGLRQNFGTMTKPLHAGKAAESGIISAVLAKHGFTAATNILEAPEGFCSTFSGEYELNKIVDNLGDPYEIISPGVHTKPYPSCLSTFPMIEGTISLAEEHDIKPEDVELVECCVASLPMKALIHNSPKTAIEGKFSAQFVTAISLLDRRVSLDQFTDEKVQDPRTVNLMKKIKKVNHPDFPEFRVSPVTTASIVKIKLKDGREFSKRVDIAKGNPEKPLSKKELEVKFRDCAETIIGRDRVDQSIDMISNLDKIQDINQLIDVVSAKRPK
jgi:2-methylcitrate dehydratase PrpD